MAGDRASAVDVAIVGGGIVGASAAAELAAAGASVRLYERAAIAAGASGRNSGAVWQPADPALDALYRETLSRYRRLETEIASELPPHDPDRGFSLPADPVGILSLGRDAAALAERAARYGATHPHFEATFLDEAELRALEPGLAPGLVALRRSIGYPVVPNAATRALSALARTRGATIVEGADVRVARSGERAVGVEHDGRVEPAGAVIVAAGPWSPALVDPSGRWRPIRPFWGVVVGIRLAEPPTHVLEEATVDATIEPSAGPLPGPDLGAATVASGLDFSLVTALGGSALGSTFLAAEPDPAEYVDRLVRHGAGFVPAIADAEVLGTRACARPLSLDGQPLVGPVPGVEGLWIAAGHGPWGLSTGPASGRHVADLVLGRTHPVPPDLAAAFDPARFGDPA